MRLLFYVLVLFFWGKHALAQKSENIKLETRKYLSIAEQIPYYKKKVVKKDKISGAFLDSLLDYSLKENWQQGKLWYYYFSIHRSYQENPTHTNAINKQYKALLEAYRSEADFDSTSFSIVSHCIVYSVNAIDYYWGLALAKEQFQKTKDVTVDSKYYKLQKLYVFNYITQIYIRSGINYNLAYYIDELSKLDAGRAMDWRGFKYSILADMYGQIHKYSLMNIYKDSAQMSLLAKPQSATALNLFNLKTHNFLFKRQLDSAKHYLAKTLIFTKENIEQIDKIDYSKYLNLLALNYDSLEKKNRTLEHNLDNIGHYLINIEQYEKAREILRGLYDIKLELKEYDFIRHILPLVVAAYEGTRNLDSALYFSEYYNRLSDSINNFQQKKLYNTFISELQYEIEAKERSLQYKDQALLYKNRLLWGGVAIGLIFVLLLLSLYRNMRLKNKFQIQKIAQIKAERERHALSSKINGAEVEKKSLAVELHDGIANDVWALNLNIDKIRRTFPENNVAHAYIKELKNEINQVFENVLNMARNLKPNLLVKNGLSKVVMALCERINHQYDRQIANLEILNVIPRFDIEQELILYRIIQELTFNALKHAQATEIYIQLAYTEHSLDLTLEDNGLGIHNSDAAKQHDGLGLQNIKERVQLLNGYIEFSSLKTSGTSVYVKFENLRIAADETTR